MMQKDEDIQKLEQALAKAHRAREAPLFGPEWSEHVMRDVRRVAVQRARSSVVPGIERLVWRTATLAAAGALMLTISLIAWAWSPSSEDVGIVAEEIESAPLFFD